MINWKDISDLHVISRLEQIISNWFGVELYYTDENCKIQSHLKDEDYEYDNHFLNVQMKMPHGFEQLGSDIERVTEQLHDSDESVIIYDSSFPHVKGIGARIEIDGEYSGTVFAYPFIRNAITEAEVGEIKKSLIQSGATEEDASAAIEHLKRMFPREKESLKDLVDFVSEEIVSFHEEIAKRESEEAARQAAREADYDVNRG